MKIIFCDTTARKEDFKNQIVTSMIFMPAIKRGDLLALLNQKDFIEEVIIVDGVFADAPSITHKEIIFALSEGLKITGISSIGALRARELYSLGMMGYGKIFNMYLNDEIESDDEVAISYVKKSGNIITSIPLINIRETVNRNNLDYEIIQICRNIFYKERYWGKIKKELSKDQFKSLFRSYIDLKRDDVLMYFEAKPLLIFESNNTVKNVLSIHLHRLIKNRKYKGIIDYVLCGLEKQYYSLNLKDTSGEEYSSVLEFCNLPDKYSVLIKYIIIQKFKDIQINDSTISRFKRQLLEELEIYNVDDLISHLKRKNIPGKKITFIFSTLYLLYRYFNNQYYCTLET